MAFYLVAVIHKNKNLITFYCLDVTEYLTLCPCVISYMYHFQVWGLLTGDAPRPSLFMGVPTIYSKLIQYHDKSNLTEQEKERIKSKCEQLRLKKYFFSYFWINISFYSGFLMTVV